MTHFLRYGTSNMTSMRLERDVTSFWVRKVAYNSTKNYMRKRLFFATYMAGYKHLLYCPCDPQFLYKVPTCQKEVSFRNRRLLCANYWTQNDAIFLLPVPRKPSPKLARLKPIGKCWYIQYNEKITGNSSFTTETFIFGRDKPNSRKKMRDFTV